MNDSEDVRFLLDGLGVRSVRDLRRLVELGRAADRAAELAPYAVGRTAEEMLGETVPRPDVGPGWRSGGDGRLYYSSAWLDERKLTLVKEELL